MAICRRAFYRHRNRERIVAPPKTRLTGNENQPEIFLHKVFRKPPWVMDVRAFGSWIGKQKVGYGMVVDGLASPVQLDLRKLELGDMLGSSLSFALTKGSLP